MTGAVSEARSWRALAALCVGLFMTLLDQSLVAVALPHIREDFDASLNQAVWVSAVYLLTFAVPLLVAGRLGDRFGQRRVYLTGMVLFTLTAFACAFAPTIEWLIALRAVQGLGGALINPQPLSIITRIFPRGRRGTAMGVWASVAGSTGLFGPVIGGLLVGGVGWRAVFLFYVPLGLVSLFMVAWWVPRLPQVAARIDLASALLSLLAVLGVVVALQQGPEFGWAPWIFGVLLVGLAAFAAFVWLQRRTGESALVPPALFAQRNFRLGIIAVSTLGFAVYSVNLPIMFYLQQSAGLSAQMAGLILVPTGALSVVLSPIAGRLTDRLAPGLISRVGFLVLIAAMALFGAFMLIDAPVSAFLLPVALLGAANSLAWSPNATITMRDLPVHLTGAGSGVYNTARQVGAVLGAAAIGAVMQIGEDAGSFGAAVGTAMFVPTAVLVIGLVAVSRFRSTGA